MALKLEWSSKLKHRQPKHESVAFIVSRGRDKMTTFWKKLWPQTVATPSDTNLQKYQGRAIAIERVDPKMPWKQRANSLSN